MRLQHTPRGFTLLDLLVGMAIFIIVLAAIYLMYWTSHTTFTRGKTKIDIQQHARVALETMVREIRMAGYDPSTPPVIPAQPVGFTQAMQIAGGSDIQFIADVEGTGTAQRVRYQLVGNQIRREISTNAGGAAWNAATISELADKVKTDDPVNNPGLRFTYLDANDVATATLANIRRVTIVVRIEEPAGGKTETTRLDTDVRPRNL